MVVLVPIVRRVVVVLAAVAAVGRAERDGEKSEMVKKMDEKSGIDREKKQGAD